MKLSDIIVADAIIADLDAASRDEAIEQLVSALAGAGAISKRSVKEAVAAVIERV